MNVTVKTGHYEWKPKLVNVFKTWSKSNERSKPKFPVTDSSQKTNKSTQGERSMEELQPAAFCCLQGRLNHCQNTPMLQRKRKHTLWGKLKKREGVKWRIRLGRGGDKWLGRRGFVAQHLVSTTRTHLDHGGSSPSRCSSCSGPRRSGSPGRGVSWSALHTDGRCSCDSAQWPPYRTPHRDWEPTNTVSIRFI